MSKFIFITGGVISGLGKGVTAASIGKILKARNFSVFIQKFDPYLNVDAGTISPTEHGEVFVTKDGGETDLDLGHYERFMGIELNKNSNYTSGQIYNDIIKKERKGDFNGKTVQIIPHVTDYINDIILNASKKTNADFVITEIGGTIGDIESHLFIYAISNFASKYKKNVFFIHISFIPFLSASQEFKSKPTQHSIQEIRKFGINPNMLLLRSNKKINSNIIEKISKYCFLNKENIVNVFDQKNIYEIPLIFEKSKIANSILDFFKMTQIKPQLQKLKNFIQLCQEVEKNKKEINLLMAGKYINIKESYMSIMESLKISSIYQKIKINLKWQKSDDINKNNVKQITENIDGVLILPGFGKRGFEGKVVIANYLRDKKIPTFGICYGMQAMTIVQAQKIGIKDAITTENDDIGTPIIDIIKNNNNNSNLGGTLRLGEQKTTIKKNTKAHEFYNKDIIFERHRHRYEVNPLYREKLEQGNFIFSGFNKAQNLAEIIEMTNHPFYLGVQYHPEFKTQILKSHPLFDAFIKKSIEYSNKK